jgi:mannosyltransferase
MLLLDARADQGALSASRRPRPWGWSLLFGALAMIVSVTGSWIPSLWGDEAASSLAARRSLPGLFSLLQYVDAVHGTYYFFLHFWIEVFGFTAFSMRFPSSIAVGVCATLVVWLCARLGGTRIAVLAGIACVVIPRLTYAGSEARAYAFDAAFAAAMVVVIAEIVLRPPGRHLRLWIAYGVLLVVGVYFFLYTGLMALAVGAFLALTPALRSNWRRWLVASAAAFVLSLPVIVLAFREKDQISYLANRINVTPDIVIVQLWFGRWWFAGIAWLIIAAAVIAYGRRLLRARRALRDPAGSSSGSGLGRKASAGAPAKDASAAGAAAAVAPIVAGSARARDLLTLLALCWLVIPVGVLMVGSAAMPVFTMRYGTFAAPAAAVLIGLGIDSIARTAGRGLARRRGADSAAVFGAVPNTAVPNTAVPGIRRRTELLVATVFIVVVVAASAPVWVSQRTPNAKNESDWNQIATTVKAGAEPGDAIVFDDSVQPSRRTRLAYDTAQPGAFGPVEDVLLKVPAAENYTWYAKTYAVSTAAALGRFAGVDRVWLVEYDTPAALVGKHRVDTWGVSGLEALGYHEASATQLHASVVYLYEKHAS